MLNIWWPHTNQNLLKLNAPSPTRMVSDSTSQLLAARGQPVYPLTVRPMLLHTSLTTHKMSVLPPESTIWSQFGSAVGSQPHPLCAANIENFTLQNTSQNQWISLKTAWGLVSANNQLIRGYIGCSTRGHQCESLGEHHTGWSLWHNWRLQWKFDC